MQKALYANAFSASTEIVLYFFSLNQSCISEVSSSRCQVFIIVRYFWIGSNLCIFLHNCNWPIFFLFWVVFIWWLGGGSAFQAVGQRKRKQSATVFSFEGIMRFYIPLYTHFRGQNLVIWALLAAREAEKCILSDHGNNLENSKGSYTCCKIDCTSNTK